MANTQLTRTLTISNSGTGDLDWTVVEGCDTPADIPWAAASPISGTTAAGSSSAVDLVFDATGLTANVYTGTLCIGSNDADEPQVPISLTLSVTAAASVSTDSENSASGEEGNGLPGLRTMALALPFALVAGAGIRWRSRHMRRR
jgi:hypothetical protein